MRLFNDAVLASGYVPLELLERVVDQQVASRQATQYAQLALVEHRTAD